MTTATTRKTTPPLPTTTSNMNCKSNTCTLMLCSLFLVVIACVDVGSAFLPVRPTTHHNRQNQMGFLIHTNTDNICLSRSRLFESAAASDGTASAETEEIDIGSMRVSEIKKELVRLNVSSKDCFDKESLVEKLLQARQQPQPSSSQQESSQPEQSTRSESELSTTATATTSAEETKAAPTAGTSTPTPTAKEDTQIKEQLQEEVSALSVKELRTELGASGIRWAGMLEKRDLVDAVVKCRQETAGFSVTGKMRPSQVTDLTADELTQELTSTDTFVLLDVYATWCGPCQMMVPHLEGTAAVLGSRVRVGKLDSDKHPEMAGGYKVQGLPTVLLLRGDEIIDRVEGMLTKEQLVPWVEKHL